MVCAKNRIYKQNTYIQYIHTVSGAENSLYNFDLPLKTHFLRSILRKRLTIEVSALDELMVLSIHTPLVS